jgi:hypothetical protein
MSELEDGEIRSEDDEEKLAQPEEVDESQQLVIDENFTIESGTGVQTIPVVYSLGAVRTTESSKVVAMVDDPSQPKITAYFKPSGKCVTNSLN